MLTGQTTQPPCMACMQEFQSAAGDHSSSIEAMLAEEGTTRVPPDYLSLQPHIGPEHRHFLVSWVVTVRPPRPIPRSTCPLGDLHLHAACRSSCQLRAALQQWGSQTWRAVSLSMHGAACSFQAAACLNYGAFTSALATNLLDRFMATQRPSVSPSCLQAPAAWCVRPACVGSSPHKLGRKRWPVAVHAGRGAVGAAACGRGLPFRSIEV